MAFVELPDDSDLDGSPAPADVANYDRLFAHRPAAYAAWRQLNGAIKQAMDPRRYELATLAAARQLGSSYCCLAHGKVLLDRFLDPAQLRAIAIDHRAAGLDDLEVAVMDLAEKVAADAGSVTQADVDRLRALGVQPDAAYWQLDPAVRDVLTVGRAIAD
jgi:alkylhydroperoxidase family enzyme